MLPEERLSQSLVIYNKNRETKWQWKRANSRVLKGKKIAFLQYLCSSPRLNLGSNFLGSFYLSFGLHGMEGIYAFPSFSVFSSLWKDKLQFSVGILWNIYFKQLPERAHLISFGGLHPSAKWRLLFGTPSFVGKPPAWDCCNMATVKQWSLLLHHLPLNIKIEVVLYFSFTIPSSVPRFFNNRKVKWFPLGFEK